MKDMDDFSIYLETLGTRCTAPIISIGVQQFNRDTGKLGSTFYREIDIDSAIKSGRVQADTLAWWITQNKNAQRVFTNKDKTHLATALQELTTWMRAESFAPKVWGNGATFDISILEYAYDHGCVGLREPWHFMAIRDIRTLLDVTGFDKTTVPAVGVAHNALDDATYQAKVVIGAWQAAKGMRGPEPVSKPRKGEKIDKATGVITKTDDEDEVL